MFLVVSLMISLLTIKTRFSEPHKGNGCSWFSEELWRAEFSLYMSLKWDSYLPKIWFCMLQWKLFESDGKWVYFMLYLKALFVFEIFSY